MRRANLAAADSNEQSYNKNEKPSPKKVPRWAEPLIEIDRKFSSKLGFLASPNTPHVKFRATMKMLEVSCHGLSWIGIIFIGLWYALTPRHYELLVNLLFGIIFDMLAVAFIKAAVRRTRPNCNANDMFATIAVDKFSFPSGHASRAVMLIGYFVFFCDCNVLIQAVVVAWAASVCLSRLLLGRHFITDVAGGAVLGVIEALVIGLFWISQDTSVWLVNAFSDVDSRQSYD